MSFVSIQMIKSDKFAQCIQPLVFALSDLLFAALLSQGLHCVHTHSAQELHTVAMYTVHKEYFGSQQFHTGAMYTAQNRPLMKTISHKAVNHNGRNVPLIATSARSSQSARSKAQIRTVAHSCGSHSSARVELLRPLVAPSRCQLRE